MSLSCWRHSTFKIQRISVKPLYSGIKRKKSVVSSENVKQFASDAKPFHKIPGPLSLPIIGTLYLSTVPHHHKNALKKYQKYGPLVREEILPGETTVWVFDPNDMECIFQSENHLPQRLSHRAVETFRKDRPEVYNSGGLLPMNGEEWWRLRREFQKGLSAPQAVRSYLPATDSIIQDFVSSQLLRPYDDFLSALSRLFLQLLFEVVFHEKFDCFTYQEMKPNSRSSRLIKATLTANSLMSFFDLSRDIRKNTHWKKFEAAMLYMEEVAAELLEKSIASVASNQKSESNDGAVPSLLELYLTSPNLDKKDIIGMIVDLLLAAIDTTAYTASFALYHLGTNERVQDFVKHEARSIIVTPDQPITADVLAQVPYTRAVLKEVFRMNPISVGVGRIASQDLILSGYHIPKGTNLVTMNQVSSRFSKYFVNPNDFIPERWLKGSPIQVKENPYLVLPFGHGPRACIARRLAEQHLLTLLLRITQGHSIRWTSTTTLDCQTDLINKPDGALRFSFSRE